MSLTAIFIFAGNCGQCVRFKLTGVYDGVKQAYIKEGVKLAEMTAPSIGQGLAPTGVHKAFHYIDFYPSLVLLPTNIYNNINQHSLQVVLSNMRVMNGTVSSSPPSIRMNYTTDFMVVENYLTFLKSFRPALVREPTREYPRIVAPKTLRAIPQEREISLTKIKLVSLYGKK